MTVSSSINTSPSNMWSPTVRCTSTLAWALLLALTISIITLTTPYASLANLLTLSLRECGHVVLVSCPRHGSTWFLDSVEGCPSRETAKGTYSDLITNSELWTKHKGPVYNITAMEAARYVQRNHSVKIFPTAYRQSVERLKTFLEEVKKRGVPVFVLNRRLNDSYSSLKDAKENHAWSQNSMGVQKERVVDVDDGHVGKYMNNTQKFFENVKQVLKDVGLIWDRLDYEVIVGMKEIVGQRNQCVVKNCNFL